MAQVQNWYFIDPNRAEDELNEVLNSFSVLGAQQWPITSGNGQLRLQIVNSYSVLLDNYPHLAGNVARSLTAWQINAHTERLSEILNDKTLRGSEAFFDVSYYLSRASTFTSISAFR